VSNELGTFPGQNSIIPADQRAAHDFKLAADHGYAAAKFMDGRCLQNGKGVVIELKGAAHYFKLAADQGYADAQ
jgi:TPR repeat protein